MVTFFQNLLGAIGEEKERRGYFFAKAWRCEWVQNWKMGFRAGIQR
jgi:hypothetical protein